MKPILVASLILLLLTLCLALVGTILARRNKIKVRNAANYTRICTVVVLASFYALTVFDWPGLQLRRLDLWSLMVILAIVTYALIWGAVAFQLNKAKQPQFGDSFMLSMLYTDAERQPNGDFAPTQINKRK
jgi:hypothetical protein